MIVLSHRGYWKDAAEKNQPVAFRRSFDLGFGTETDVRDRNGELVISHDPPRGGEMTFDEMLDILGDRDLPLAVNVKADGLADPIKAAFARRPHLTRWFLFDMSVPDTVQQLKRGNPVFARLSEYEPTVPERVASACGGVWLDGFDGQWWTPALVGEWTARGKAVCVVSPDLHKRDPEACWAGLAAHPFADPGRVMICTDRPEQAAAVFGGSR